MRYLDLLKIVLKILFLALATTFIFYWFGWAVESFVKLDPGVYILNKENEYLRFILSLVFIFNIALYLILYLMPRIGSILEILEKETRKK